MDDELVIPEDLREAYRAITNYEFIGYGSTKQLIERIARLEANCAAMRNTLIGVAGGLAMADGACYFDTQSIVRALIQTVDAALTQANGEGGRDGGTTESHS